MPVFRLNIRRNCFSPISFIFLRWHQRIHMYIFIVILLIASLISFYQPFGLLFNMKHIVPERPSINPIRNALINKQKQDQQIAYEWLSDLWKNSKNYSHLFSHQTDQSRFYDFMQIKPLTINSTSYHLFEQPKQNSLIKPSIDTDQIVISILYSKQDTDHRDGKFYVGQILHYLLKNYHSRFIITLCENNNTDHQVSDEIHLIRRLVPVFIIDTFDPNRVIDIFEQEKQAHLQCILANFQSFSNTSYLLLLQDDAQPDEKDFYERFLSLIETRVKQQWPLDGYRQQPAFLKIYHPRWLIDYLHPSFYIIVQLFATSLALTYVIFVCFYLVQIIRQNNQRSFHNHFLNINQLWWQYHDMLSFSHNIKSIYRLVSININLVLFFFYFLLITFVLILLNHSNVSWTWRSLHPSLYAIYPAPSCCLPGVVYFRSTYTQVVDYLNSVQCRTNYAIDTAFDDLPKRTNLQTYLVEPNLIHHIGLYSRLRHTYINPYLLD